MKALTIIQPFAELIAQVTAFHRKPHLVYIVSR